MRKVNYTEYNAVASTEENADLVDLAARVDTSHPMGQQGGNLAKTAFQLCK